MLSLSVVQKQVKSSIPMLREVSSLLANGDSLTTYPPNIRDTWTEICSRSAFQTVKWMCLQPKQSYRIHEPTTVPQI